MRHVRKILKILSLILAVILALGMIMVLLLSRGVLNDRLSKVISSQGSRILNAELEVHNIQGNPLSAFWVNGIRVTRRDTTDLSLDSLKIDYRIGALLHKKVHLRALHLKGLHLYGVQKSDSSWSFEKALPVAEDGSAEPDTARPSAPWQIRLDRLSLEGVSANLSPLDTSMIPSSIRLEGTLSFLMSQDSIGRDFMDVTLHQLSLQTRSPNLTVNRMQGKFRNVQNQISWRKAGIDFIKTHVRSSGTAILPGDRENNDKVGVTAQLEIDPLSLQEFHPWMSKGKLYGSPAITVDLRHDSNRQSLELKLRENNQSLSLSGWIRQIMTRPKYSMTLVTENLNGFHWTRDSTYSSALTGDLQLEGDGFDIRDNAVVLTGDLAEAGYKEYRMDNLTFQARKNQDTLRGNLRGRAWFGGLSSDFSLQEIFKQPVYDLQVAFQHLDISRLTADTALRSDLNLALRAEGKGTDPDSLQASIELDMTDSHFMDWPLNDMHTEMSYNRQAYRLRGLQLNSPYFSLGLQGEGHLRGQNRLSFDFIAGDMQSFTRRTGLPEINFSGGLSGEALGSLDSMHVSVSYDLSNLYYDTMYVRKLEGHASALLSRDSLLGGELLLSADSSYGVNQWIERISLQSSLDTNYMQNRLDVRVNDSLSLNIHTGLALEKDPRIFMKNLQLQIDTATWQGGSDSTRITLGKDSVDIDHWILRSGKQEIGVEGIYRFRGKENLHVWVERLDIDQWSPLLRFPYSLRGSLSSDISLEGTASQPRLEGNVDIINPGMDTIQLKRIHAGLRYDSSVLSLEGHVDAGIYRMIHTRARLPLNFSLTDSLVIPGKSTPIQASLMVDSLDAALANPFLEDRGMKVRGMIDATIEVNHTLGDPEFKGRLDFDGGKFSYPAEGIDYKNIAIRSRFDNRRLQLEQVHLESGAGYLNMQGYADMPFLDPTAPDSLYVELRGKDFEALRSGRIEAVLEPSVILRGAFSRPVLEGDLNIPRASVNVDAFRQAMAVTSDDPNAPLLIEAMKDTLSYPAKVEDTTQRAPSLSGSDFYHNLRGTFNIQIPGNTWVKGQDMNFEVQGRLKAIKESEQVDLFGTLNVKRGFFRFYGKKFDFEEGEIIFTGGREINPRIRFTIAYMFRDPDRERQRLTIEITGRTSQPNLQFRLNEQVIQEKEALSYLMFGKSTGQLTTAEQTSLEERTGQMAASFALDRISTAVTRALGNGLGLDMVELEAGKDWRSGNVKIGKYITDDLYLSYQKTFAFDKKEKAIDADRITLEYQIMRSLFLQATNQMYNSGFDLIFKKSWR